MKENLTELVFIIDRSGSMSGLESDTIGGINAALERNRKQDGECVVSAVMFNERQKVVIDRESIKDVKPLTDRDYQVGGCTALLDAVGGSIKHISRVQRYLPEEYRAEHVIFVITTDGLENASTRYSYQEVKHAIEEKQREGWEFLFLGANIDAAAEAGRIGIPDDRAATYIADSKGSAVMFDSVAAETCVMRSRPRSAGRRGGAWRDRIRHDSASRGK